MSRPAENGPRLRCGAACAAPPAISSKACTPATLATPVTLADPRSADRRHLALDLFHAVLARDLRRDEALDHLEIGVGDVGRQIGAIAKPDEVRFAEALPKTRSGKIMRRLLKEIASGNTVTGDTTTLEDFSVLAKLARDEEE